jgi:hypothetical protein
MRALLLTTTVVLALGCGEAYEASRRTAETKAWQPNAPAQPAPSVSHEVLPSVSALQRKIIHTAEIQLVVEDFTPIPSKVAALTKQFNGYVKSSQLAGSPGNPRSGCWTIRVPVDQYEDFLAAARQLGEVQTESSDAQDVTEEFYDVEARIRNKKKQEDRLLQLLTDATGKLPDVLAVEKELARVREEIEQMQGRVRLLSDLTAMTTVTLRVNEIKDYVPETAPTYATRLKRSLNVSINALSSTAQSLSIGLVAALPWLGVLLPPLIVVWLVVRIYRKRRR